MRFSNFDAGRKKKSGRDPFEVARLFGLLLFFFFANFCFVILSCPASKRFCFVGTFQRRNSLVLEYSCVIPVPGSHGFSITCGSPFFCGFGFLCRPLVKTPVHILDTPMNVFWTCSPLVACLGASGSCQWFPFLANLRYCPYVSSEIICGITHPCTLRG